MKIAYDGKRYFQNSSGLGNYARDLVRILATHFPEHEFSLLNKKKTERGAELLSHKNVKFEALPKSFLARQLQMGKLAQEIQADIFHGLSGELPIIWGNKPIKKIVTVHDLIFERFPQYYSFFDRKVHFLKFKKAVKEADAIIAISEQTKKDILHYSGIDAEKIHVIYQGCHQAFKKKQSNQQLLNIKEKFNLPKRFILNVGTIEERKNLLSVIRALKKTAIPLVVVGKKTPYYQQVEKEIKENKHQVQFLEGVSMEELAGIYQMADIFIYPSFFEGFGIPIIESLFSSTPVITSNIGCMPEAGGQDSLYIDPHDINEMRDKILFLWNDENQRQVRAKKGLAFVQKFNDVEIAKQLMNLYKSI